jgi:hypothetical protein
MQCPGHIQPSKVQGSQLWEACLLTCKLGNQLQQHRQDAGARAPEVVQQPHQVGQPAAQVLPQHAQQPRQPGSREQ